VFEPRRHKKFFYLLTFSLNNLIRIKLKKTPRRGTAYCQADKSQLEFTLDSKRICLRKVQLIDKDFMMRHLHFSLFSMCLNSLITIYVYCIIRMKAIKHNVQGIRLVRYRNEKECRYRNQSGTGIMEPGPVPERNGVCRGHQPCCRCSTMALLQVALSSVVPFTEYTQSGNCRFLAYIPS
jgi:hypothetical protein